MVKVSFFDLGTVSHFSFGLCSILFVVFVDHAYEGADVFDIEVFGVRKECGDLGFEFVIWIGVVCDDGDSFLVEFLVNAFYVFYEVVVRFKVLCLVDGVAPAIEARGLLSKSLYELVDASLLLVASSRFVSAVEGVVDQALCGFVLVDICLSCL